MKRAAEQMQQQLKAADDINFALKNRLAIAQVTEPVAKRMLEYDIKQNEIAKEYDELKKQPKRASVALSCLCQVLAVAWSITTTYAVLWAAHLVVPTALLCLT
jgi:hypothetical protein